VILHLTTFLQGGAGRVIAALALAQRASGHDVLVVGDAGGADGYGNYPEYLAALRRGGVPFVAVRSTFTRDLGLNLAAAAALTRIRGAGRTRIVHAHAAIPALIGRIFAGSCMRPVPVLQTMHGWGVRKTPAQAATDVAVMNSTDLVVVPSGASRSLLIAQGVDPGRIALVPYGIGDRPSGRVPSADRLRIGRLRERGLSVALCTGTIGPRKNQRLLVDALATDEGDGVAAVFIGDGDAAGLRQYARARGVGSRVLVLGPRPDASRYLALADVFALVSRSEGLPLAVLEALRDDVPVVASNVPEIREIFTGGATAWLCDPDDARGVAESLRKACRAPLAQRQRLTARNRRIFLERYSRDRMIEAYHKIYERLGSARRRASARRSEAWSA
jgi:glycosyltransferase involved in cell wall biosynthesis